MLHGSKVDVNLDNGEVRERGMWLFCWERLSYVELDECICGPLKHECNVDDKKLYFVNCKLNYNINS